MSVMSVIRKVLIAIIVSNLEVSSSSSSSSGGGFFTDKKYNSTLNWSSIRHIHMSAPLIVKVNNSLIHVLDSRDQKHAIQIESTDEWKSCRLPLELVYPLRYPRRATSLGNGKLVVWLLNYRFTRYKHVGLWMFAVVDPKKCSQRNIKINDFDVDIIDVVPYNDTFDVFISSLSYDNKPRYIHTFRYNDEGERIPSPVHHVIPDLDSCPFYVPNRIRVHAVKRHEATEGYFYVQVRVDTNNLIIKRLDADFAITKSLVLKYSEHYGFDSGMYSTDHEHLSLCRYQQHRQLHCYLFNALLKQKSNVSLSYENLKDHLSRIVHLTVQNMADGGLILVFALKINYRMGTPIYAQRIGIDGKVSESTEFGRIHCEIQDLETFRMKGQTYCVAVICDEIVRTRCIEIN